MKIPYRNVIINEQLLLFYAHLGIELENTLFHHSEDTDTLHSLNLAMLHVRFRYRVIMQLE